MGLEAIRQAMRHLWAHKVRSTLTLFGLVWGAAAVIFLVGWGRGVTVMLEDGFFRAGKNMGEVWPGKLSEEFTPAVDRRYLWFNNYDVEALRKRARLPEIIGAEAWEMLPTVYHQRALSLDIRGIDPEVMEIRGVSVAAGRGITHSDLEPRRRVVVLGDKTRRKLLGAKGTIGSYIRIAGKPFRVVGFLAPVGTQLSRDRMEIDDQAWVPLTTVQQNWPAWWTDEPVVNKIIYRMRDRHLLEETEDEVRAILADQFGVSPDDEEAVGVWSSVKMLNKLPLDELRGLMFILATATLMIGGIGVLNMMIDAVHERRYEIGIRLAVGARRREVVAQFFIETVTICFLGGLIGCSLGVGFSLLLGHLEVPDLIPVPVISWDIVILAFVVLVFVGVLAGVIPAWRAAQVDPSETLRME